MMKINCTQQLPKKITTLILPFQKGLNEWQFKVGNLSAGQYFIKVSQTRLRITTPFLKIY